MVTVQQALNKAMPVIALELAGELRMEAPADTGRLRSSIKIKAETGKLIITMVDYGMFVEFGTAPHVIEAKKGALAFNVGNDKVFAKKVKHPGTRPNNFIRRTIRQKLPKIIARNIERFMQ